MAWALQRAHLHFQGLLASPHPLQQRAEVTEVGGQELPLSMDSKGESSPHLRPADHPSEMRLPLANTAFHGFPTPPNPSVLQHTSLSPKPQPHHPPPPRCLHLPNPHQPVFGHICTGWGTGKRSNLCLPSPQTT